MKIKFFEEFSTFNLEEVASGLCAEFSDILNSEDIDYSVLESEKFIRIESKGEVEDHYLKKSKSVIDKTIEDYKILYPEISDWYFIYDTDKNDNYRFICFILDGSWIKDILSGLERRVIKSDIKRSSYEIYNYNWVDDDGDIITARL